MLSNCCQKNGPGGPSDCKVFQLLPGLFPGSQVRIDFQGNSDGGVSQEALSLLYADAGIK